VFAVPSRDNEEELKMEANSNNNLMQRKHQGTKAVHLGFVENSENPKQTEISASFEQALQDHLQSQRMSARLPKKAMMKQLPPKERFAPR
jgi:hypothetical protein